MFQPWSGVQLYRRRDRLCSETMSILLTITCAMWMAAIAADGNLLPASSFDHPDMKWAADGQGATGNVDPTVRQSTGKAWYFADRGPQMGQTSCPVVT